MRTKRLFRTVLPLVFLSAAMPAIAADDGKQVDGRPIVIRYDGEQINLSAGLVCQLLYRESIRKAIHEDVTVATVFGDPGTVQPPGVFVGMLQFKLKEGSNADVDALFKSARKVIRDELSGRIGEPVSRRLQERRDETEVRLKEYEDEMEQTRRKMEEVVGESQLETMQSQLETLQRQRTETKIETNVDQMKSKLLEAALKEILTKKDVLEDRRREIEQNVAQGAVFEGQLQHLKMQKAELEQKYGAGHPKIEALAARITAIGKELGSVDVELLREKEIEIARFKQLANTVTEEIGNINKQSAQLANESLQRKMAQSVGEYKREMLEREIAPVREQLSDLRKQMPRYQNRLRHLENSMQTMLSELQHVETEIRNLQPVTVEIW